MEESVASVSPTVSQVQEVSDSQKHFGVDVMFIFKSCFSGPQTGRPNNYSSTLRNRTGTRWRKIIIQSYTEINGINIKTTGVIFMRTLLTTLTTAGHTTPLEGWN